MLKQAKAEGVSLVGPRGLLAGVTKTVLQAALDTEMADHLGHEKGDRPPFPAANHRNGTSPKTVLTEVGPIPLESRPAGPDWIYRVLLVDAIFVKIRVGAMANRPVYEALGINCHRQRDVLGMWAGTGGEDAKAWMGILAELRNRGVEDSLHCGLRRREGAARRRSARSGRRRPSSCASCIWSGRA